MYILCFHHLIHDVISTYTCIHRRKCIAARWSVIYCTGELVDNLAIGDFPPGDHSLDITVIDVHGQNVTHPTLTFTRPPLLEVQCSVHNSQTIDCTSTTIVESQMCFIDEEPHDRFNCSLPRDINELAATYNLTPGDHNLTVITLDEFAQGVTTMVIFTVFRKLKNEKYPTIIWDGIHRQCIHSPERTNSDQINFLYSFDCTQHSWR